jgi:phosphomevalonate kinase
VQTALLDELSELEGVVGGVVPGAGGYDAVALLVHDEQGVADRIRAHIEKWECPVPDNFGGQIGKVRLLGVTHGADGLKNELAMRYSEWI